MSGWKEAVLALTVLGTVVFVAGFVVLVFLRAIFVGNQP